MMRVLWRSNMPVPLPRGKVGSGLRKLHLSCVTSFEFKAGPSCRRRRTCFLTSTYAPHYIIHNLTVLSLLEPFQLHLFSRKSVLFRPSELTFGYIQLSTTPPKPRDTSFSGPSLLCQHLESNDGDSWLVAWQQLASGLGHMPPGTTREGCCLWCRKHPLGRSSKCYYSSTRPKHTVG
jgi:hypothetical protein